MARVAWILTNRHELNPVPHMHGPSSILCASPTYGWAVAASTGRIFKGGVWRSRPVYCFIQVVKSPGVPLTGKTTGSFSRGLSDNLHLLHGESGLPGSQWCRPLELAGLAEPPGVELIIAPLYFCPYLLRAALISLAASSSSLFTTWL